MSAERKHWHFGVLSFTGSGHLNPFIALSQHLRDQGHRVTFFEKPKIEKRVRDAGLDFCPIGSPDSPFKSKQPNAHAGLLSELSTLRFNLRRIEHDLAMYLRETPSLLTHAGVNVLLVNEIALTGPTLAELLGLPYFVLSTSVPHNFGWNAYPWFSGYRFSRSWFSHLENLLLEVTAVRMRGPLCRALNKSRIKLGLDAVRGVSRNYPPLAQITPLPEWLDLPRRSVPEYFHYTAPFVRRGTRPDADFPWDRLDGRPIIYASLGTTRNVQPAIFHLIADACQNMERQLVISLGGRFDPSAFSNLPGNPLVVKYAPQVELLKLADLAITHGGPNTTFEALMAGKPMIAIPIAYDQPAIAARLERLGIAVVLPIMRLSADRIRTAVEEVLRNRCYHDAALEMQKKLRSLNGIERAAEIVEAGLEKYAANQANNRALRDPARPLFAPNAMKDPSIASH